MCLRAIKKQSITASVYLSSARSAITLGHIETYALNSSPVKTNGRQIWPPPRAGDQRFCYGTRAF